MFHNIKKNQIFINKNINQNKIMHKIKNWNILHTNFSVQIWIRVMMKKHYSMIADVKLEYEKLSLSIFFINQNKIMHKIKNWNILHTNFTVQIWIRVMMKKHYSMIAEVKLEYEKLSLSIFFYKAKQKS